MTMKDRINNSSNLTPMESDFAKYLLSNMEKIEIYTIQQLSEHTFVSKSCILRFCKKIGLRGVKELKIAVAKELMQGEGEPVDVDFPFQEKDSLNLLCEKMQLLYKQAVTDTYYCIEYEQLSAICRLLRTAHIIDIYTHSHNIYPAKMFQERMLSIGKDVRCPETFVDKKALACASDEGCAAIILSYSGRASFISTIVKILRRKKIPIIMIGKEGTEKYYAGVKYHLAVGSREHMRQRISQFSSHIAMQYILDILFSGFFQLDYKKHMDYIRSTASILDDRNLDKEGE